MRNHAGMGPLCHFIIATVSALQENNKGISVAWGPFGALRGWGPLVFELKVTLVRYATATRVEKYEEALFQAFRKIPTNIHCPTL